MPRGDGTGPDGQGSGKGRGKRQCRGNRTGAGPTGNCVCSNCGARIPHRAGVPCNSVKCSRCGAQMIRE
jgi:hypothetical protein